MKEQGSQIGTAIHYATKRKADLAFLQSTQDLIRKIGRDCVLNKGKLYTVRD